MCNLETIQQYITDHNLIAPGNTIVVGLSGGPDSVFLLHILSQIRHAYDLKLIAAHLDHEWRDNSEQDMLFCKEVAQHLDISFESAKLSELPLPKQPKGSKEEVGRNARRLFLESVAKEHTADAIALGQHLCDQEETFFIRLIRGSTLTGLTCMKPKDGLYIRPLLEVKKKEILDYLDAHGIAYVKDPSNELDLFLRNRIRKHVIPAIRNADSRFDQNFLRTLHSIQAAEKYLTGITTNTFTSIADQVDGTWHLDTKKLFALDPFLQYRILLHWLITADVPFVPSESFLDEIMRFLHQPASKTHAIHDRWSIVKKRDTAHIVIK